MVANEVFKNFTAAFISSYHEHRLWLTHCILLQKYISLEVVY